MTGNVRAHARPLRCPRLQDSGSSFTRVQDARRWIRYGDGDTRGQWPCYYTAAMMCYTELSNNC